MTVIQKTIRVPEDHKITLDLPYDIPAGEPADISVTVTKAQSPTRRLGFLKGRIRMDTDIKSIGGEELIRLFEGEE